MTQNLSMPECEVVRRMALPVAACRSNENYHGNNENEGDNNQEMAIECR